MRIPYTLLILHFLLPTLLSTSAHSSWDLLVTEGKTLTLCRILGSRKKTGEGSMGSGQDRTWVQKEATRMG